MSPDDPALQPVIVLRVVIRSPDLDTFVSKYSRFVKDDRIFIFTKSSQPPGTRVRFTLELADGQPLLYGEGNVTRIRADTGDPSKPPGMELKFVPLDEASRTLLDRMLHARDAGTGQLSAVTSVPSSQFREETTDAQTNMGNWAPVFKEMFALVKGIFVDNSLEVYTKFSGGLEQNFVSLGGLEEAISKMGEELHSQYLLTFAPSSTTGGYHEVTVRVKVRANLDVRARYGYWIAPRAPAAVEPKNP